MRYFCYNEWDEKTGDKWVETVSEQQIRDWEWYSWQRRKSWKEGTDYVNETYCFQDCLDEWIIVNQAWESTDE
jgi:hypothetical protein